MKTWQVIVGNLGTVLDTDNSVEAINTYSEYKALSKADYGRIAGESVTLWKNGEPQREYLGTLETEEV